MYGMLFVVSNFPLMFCVSDMPKMLVWCWRSVLLMRARMMCVTPEPNVAVTTLLTTDMLEVRN